MRIFVSQLGQHLAQLPAIIMVFGDDVWLREQSRSDIRQAAFQQGFEERLSLVQESPFNWNDLAQECQSMSLFAPKRIIELELPNSKPGADGSAVLAELAQHLQDTILVLHGPKLDSSQTNSKWFKALDKNGLYVQAITPEGQHYQRWLSGRARHHGVNLQADGQQMLSQMFEGNLLAADQALAQLALLAGNRSVGGDALEKLLENQSRYTAFQLTDALLSGDTDKALTILNQLKLEEVAPVLINWSLTKELQTLLQLASAPQLNDAFKQARIWPKRQPLYKGALNRLTPAHLAKLLGYCGQLELKIKGEHDEPWSELAELCLRFNPRYQGFTLS